MLTPVADNLARLGLKEQEIKVYLSCLDHKEGMFISELTSISKLKRSTVNLIVERLTSRGFLTFRTEGKRKIFTAENPETLLFRLEDQLNDFRAIIPLLRIAAEEDQKTKVRFFENKEGVEKIFADILLSMKVSKNSKKEIMAVSSGKDIFRVLPDHQRKFIDKRIKERIPIRWLAPQNEVSEKFNSNPEDQLRKMKFFDNKKYQFNIEIDIYGSKIALIALEEQPSGVIIENKILASSFTSLFNLLWDHI